MDVEIACGGQRGRQRETEGQRDRVNDGDGDDDGDGDGDDDGDATRCRLTVVVTGRDDTVMEPYLCTYLNSHTRQILPSKSVSGVEPELSLLYPERKGDLG